MAYVVPLDIPKYCSECPFHAPYEEFCVEKGLYRKISYCLFAPQEIEDTSRDLTWMLHNKETWCPLKKGD